MPRSKYFIAVVILLAFLSSCTQASTPVETVKEKVLFLLRTEGAEDLDFMLKNELMVMVDTLKTAGYDVVLASADGSPIVTRNYNITPDLKFADVNIQDYAGLVLPCLSVALDRSENSEATAITEQAGALGLPIAAQLGGVITLNEAGILDGKDYAFIEGLDTTGKYMGNGVVEDENIITSGNCPYMAQMGSGTDRTPELTQKFIDKLAATP